MIVTEMPTAIKPGCKKYAPTGKLHLMETGNSLQEHILHSYVYLLYIGETIKVNEYILELNLKLV